MSHWQNLVRPISDKIAAQLIKRVGATPIAENSVGSHWIKKHAKLFTLKEAHKLFPSSNKYYNLSNEVDSY